MRGGGDARGELQQIAWPELRRQVASLAGQLAALGVQRGDRVGAFLPNIPQTVVAFLACASLGAIWSVCSRDMGPVAVLDRFRQIEPKVLIACDGYAYGGVVHDRMAVLRGLLDDLPSVRDVILLRYQNEAVDASLLAAPQRALHDFTTGALPAPTRAKQLSGRTSCSGAAARFEASRPASISSPALSGMSSWTVIGGLSGVQYVPESHAPQPAPGCYSGSSVK